MLRHGSSAVTRVSSVCPNDWGEAMRSVIRRAMVAAGAMVVVLGTGAGVAAAGSQAAVPGAQLWASRYNGPGKGMAAGQVAARLCRNWNACTVTAVMTGSP